ncbi:helix-hairpin-helix domain-containing protein [Paenibacillus sp. N1-5-1-14]|uniref:helix-hairpin-helix domain-containing protein n=1 Tax=Paenibacillus radicibacter TaxID=2972488 RepID=UPI0021598B62|nr:helix-hairpin-helix domain-containing protein [Paenibacillus radicibacter]MCR8642669.1 helix-hairpin-helix domain-containing protein [Paenibacillus radicibacter]
MPMKSKSPKLNLSADERSRLRKNKLLLSDIGSLNPDVLSSMLEVPYKRARDLVALATFQRVPSVGPMFAQDLVDLGYYELAELKDEDGADLVNRFELMRGGWMDPCLEDQFRLIVHYANHPDSKKQWWDFTAQRKAYRAKYGYPANRPTKELRSHYV